MVPQNLAIIVFELVVMVLAISLHDMAQAWAANRLGDPTGRMLGRVTMNPVKHFDLFGMLIWPVLFIYSSPLVLGWGKPVPMTYRNFRRKDGEMLAVLAGPLAQLLGAVVCLVMIVVLKHTVAGAAASIEVAKLLAFRAPVPTEGLPAVFPLLLLLYLCIMINLLLCVFNLIPIPFLDGGKILVHFLPYNAAQAFQRYSLWIMIGFFFIGFRVIEIAFLPLLAIFNALLAVL
jgi:Zn-dependent protease